MFETLLSWGFTLVVLGYFAYVVAKILPYIPFKLWRETKNKGINVRLTDLVTMRFRKVPPKLIVEELIKLKKAEIEIEIDNLETHYLANGNVSAVVQGLLLAKEKDVDLKFEDATAIDLAGHDVVEYVKYVSVPHDLEMPPVEAITEDKVQVVLSAKVVVRVNIYYIVGGLLHKETLVSNMTNFIISHIEKTPLNELADKNYISEIILAKKIDEGTCFKIESIEIIDLEIKEQTNSLEIN